LADRVQKIADGDGARSLARRRQSSSIPSRSSGSVCSDTTRSSPGAALNGSTPQSSPRNPLMFECVVCGAHRAARSLCNRRPTERRCHPR
jgi:hypothetical protein